MGYNYERTAGYSYNRTARGLPVGKTLENESWRVHRFANALRITDLTNAGKRGKRCIQYSVIDNVPRHDSLVMVDVVEAVTLAAKREVSAQQMELVIRGHIVSDDMFSKAPTLQFEEDTLRGVDVMPGGFVELNLDLQYVRVEAGYDRFTIRDKVDQNNLPTCIPAISGGKKSIPVFYRWVEDNLRSIKTMKYHEVLSEMGKLGIKYHSYCAMD